MFLKKLILSFLLLSFITNGSFSAEKQEKLLTQNWSFNGFFGKFDRASLQRGYQVYTEVCASCHSMNLLSYRNLSEVGGPSFSEEEVKAIASKVEVLDGPNDNGEMFKRPGKPSDKFVSPFANEKADSVFDCFSISFSLLRPASPHTAIPMAPMVTPLMR